MPEDLLDRLNLERGFKDKVRAIRREDIDSEEDLQLIIAVLEKTDTARKVEEFWNTIKDRFRSKNTKEYINRITKAKEDNLSLLYRPREAIILIKDINKYEIVDAITSMYQFPGTAHGERILITGKSQRYVFDANAEDKSENEEKNHLIVTKERRPWLLVGKYETLEKIYDRVVGLYKKLTSDF